MKQLQQRIAQCGLAVAVALASGACQDQEAVESRPITPSMEANKTQAPIGSPIEVTYRFEVAPDFEPVEKPYRVFVHFLDSHGELLFTDDHDLPQPISSWEPGSTIKYARTVFIPLYPYLGAATVEMGLYLTDTGERLGLAPDDSDLSYPVGEITLLDQKENIFLVYKEGWNQLESMPENPAVEWQWTRKEAVCSFKNPKVNSLLYLEADTNVMAFDEPLKVSLLLGENEIAQFEVSERDRFLKKFPIPASSLGEEDWVDLRIVNDQSFVPSEVGLGTDSRELGLRVYHLYVGLEPGT